MRELQSHTGQSVSTGGGCNAPGLAFLMHWSGRKRAEKVNKRYTCSCYNLSELILALF